MNNSDYIEINSDEIDLLRTMLSPPSEQGFISINVEVLNSLIEKGFVSEDDQGLFVNEYGDALVAQHEAWINGEPSHLIEVGAEQI